MRSGKGLFFLQSIVESLWEQLAAAGQIEK